MSDHSPKHWRPFDWCILGVAVALMLAVIWLSHRHPTAFQHPY